MSRVTLSFDNGPDATGTRLVVSTLADFGIKASFFVIASRLNSPALYDVAEQAKAEGHWIGNHTLSHRLPLGEDPDPLAPEREIGTAQEYLGTLAQPERYFRPHGSGLLSPALLSTAAADFLRNGRFTLVLWNVLPRDWQHADGWVPRAVAQIRQHKWSLVVLHDTEGRAMRHLGNFIKQLLADKHEIVQEFPPSCVPLCRGRQVGSLDGILGP
jgi:peptidoglycan/xylan/chitin deacetylase (PgdA/CDA1 family)